MSEDKCVAIKERLVELLQEELNHNADNVTEEAVDHVAHAIGSLAKACYYTKITEAMEENEYGVDYDENGKLYYSDRMARPRMRNYDNRMYDVRDMDRSATGRMYYPYTDEHGNVSMRVSERVGEPYNRMSGGPRFDDIEALMEFFDTEMVDLVHKATPDEKNRLKARMSQIAQGMK